MLRKVPLPPNYTPLQVVMTQSAGGRNAPQDFKRTVMLLARQGADLTVRDASIAGDTLLHHLVCTNQDSMNDAEIIEILVLHKGLANVKNAKGYTPLQVIMTQLVSGRCEFINFKRKAMLLARQGADLTVSDAYGAGNTLLHHLVCRNQDGVSDKEITEILELYKGLANVKNARLYTPLEVIMTQFTNGKCELIDFKRTAMLLARQGADLTVSVADGVRNTLLHHLVCTNKEGVNDKEITEVLTLQKSLANVKNAKEYTPLQVLMIMFVSGQCTLQDVKRTAILLVNHGADVTVRDNYSEGNTLLHHLVIENGEGVNDQEISVLANANKGLVNITNADGRTPLHALLRKRSAVSIVEVEKLVQVGADVFAKDNRGETLLHAACFSGNLVVARYLAAKGLDIQAKTNSRWTMLHYVATRSTNTALYDWLFANKVSIEAQDIVGRTALHRAAQEDNIPAVAWLIQKGADLDVRDIDNRSALSLARKDGLGEIVELLSNAIVKVLALKRPVSSNASTGSGVIIEEVETEKPVVPEAMQVELAKPILSRTNKGAEKRSDLFSANKSKRRKIEATESKKSVATNLFKAIQEMQHYGNILKSKGSSKGQVAITLAVQLKAKADEFFNAKDIIWSVPAFKNEFSILLNSKNKEMSEYRTSWSTILKNVVIALTGVGALAIVGKLIYSKTMQGRPLFFCQKMRTTSEEKIAEVKRTLARV
jgi:ankyrin repeat protein